MKYTEKDNLWIGPKQVCKNCVLFSNTKNVSVIRIFLLYCIFDKLHVTYAYYVIKLVEQEHNNLIMRQLHYIDSWDNNKIEYCLCLFVG